LALGSLIEELSHGYKRHMNLLLLGGSGCICAQIPERREISRAAGTAIIPIVAEARKEKL